MSTEMSSDQAARIPMVAALDMREPAADRPPHAEAARGRGEA